MAESQRVFRKLQRAQNQNKFEVEVFTPSDCGGKKIICVVRSQKQTALLVS